MHLPIRCRRSEDLTAAMQFLSGCMAQDYNRRKSRSGSFWSGRYRPTLVQNGRHLSRCFFYIALNMVRAGEVGHPSEWIGGSHAELLADPHAKDAVIDRAALLKCLGCVSEQAFANWYTRTLDEACATWGRARQAHWSEAAAVGDEEWVRHLATRFPSPRRRVELHPSPPSGWIWDSHVIPSSQHHARTLKPPGRARHTTNKDRSRCAAIYRVVEQARSRGSVSVVRSHRKI